MPADPSALLDRRAARPYAVTLGRGAAPASVLRRLSGDDEPGCLWGRWFGGSVVLLRRPLHVVHPGRVRDAFEVLDRQPAVRTEAQQGEDGAADRFSGLGGGWLASLGYDDGCSWLGFYDSLVRYGSDGRWVFESLGLEGRESQMQQALADWRALLQAPEPPAATAARWQLGPFSTVGPAGDTRDRYLAAVENAIGRIHRGECYQLNLCTRLLADFSGSATAMFADMAAALEPAYGALVGGARPLASFSPELFLRRRGDRVSTSPIKGTAVRGLGETDSAQLRASAKDAAENVMIVDLMRNDLSRVSRPGTVVVEDLLGLEPHPGVWHLVSTISAQLEPGVGMNELLEATFPPGSVTGAPKLSAMSAIGALEPVPRGTYTGAAGFVSPCAGAELNVVIRSFELAGGRVQLGVGGGITADSVPIREWQECLDKAGPLVSAAHSTLHPQLRSGLTVPGADQRVGGVFESVLVVGTRPLRLAEHLARLDRSCRELYGAGIPDDVAAKARRMVATAPSPSPDDRRALRLTATPGAGATVEVNLTLRPLGARLVECTLVCQPRPRRSWRHKWVDRNDLHAAEEAAAPALPYFVSDATPTPDSLRCGSAVSSTVRETSRGNLFVLDADGTWLTPPLDDEVLPGVTRRAVLDWFERAGVSYRVAPVPVNVLRNAAAALWTSSLSGAVVVSAVDGRHLRRGNGVAALINSALGVHS
ncbi:MAG: putative para-aminobenzoate synthase component [Propionibacteriaceae bacterium]|nr:putative para-aminobenzoate synthase component [Propionibacteriaceae bacterium]